ncbi:MAG: hypothetical protein WA131_03410 [Desulfitobacteriaceae bacterium]
MNKRIIIWVIVLFNLLFSTLFLSGCSNKPYLTGDNSYIIHTIKATGEIQKLPVVMPWNFNSAIMRNLLIESSFVLSDLHTPDSEELLKPSQDTILLESIFSKNRTMTLVIDQRAVTMDINSIQIEVEGSHIGRVILNQTLIFQGINNPNLQPAFQNFVKTLEVSELTIYPLSLLSMD